MKIHPRFVGRILSQLFHVCPENPHLEIVFLTYIINEATRIRKEKAELLKLKGGSEE